MTPRFQTSLFVQTLALVLATLIVTQVTAVFVIMNLPPGPPEVSTLDDIAGAVGVPAPSEIVTREGRILKTWRTPTPPEVLLHGWRHQGFRDALARRLGIAPASIMIGQRGGALMMFRPHRPPPREVTGPARFEQPLLFDRFVVAVRQTRGDWLIIEPKRAFGVDPAHARLLLVLALTALAVLPLAWIFARRLASPIAALAAGAERLGRDPGAPPLTIAGSKEVVAAVAAFNQMQDRLRRYVEFRTTTLGAVAHDLRTPLTRLRFRIESLAEPARGKIVGDIDEMEAMVSATMGLVQDVTRPRDRRKLDLGSLVQTVIDEANLTGADAAMERCEAVVVDGDSAALKRMVVNLVDNAVKYGGRARGRVFVDARIAVIEIEDGGPGISGADAERVFEPFHRVEGSRSRATGGIGLGLSIVRAVARGHGGDVTLANPPGGGLCARVSLPLAADR